MASLVDHDSAEWINASGAQAAPAMDTTGASLIVVQITNSDGGSIDDGAVTDNKSNTYTRIIGPIANGGDSVGLYYAENPTVGINHVVSFTLNGSNEYGVINVQAWSGTLTSGVLDQSSSATGTSDTAGAGSITITQADEVIVAGATFSGGADITFTAQNGYTTSDGRGNLDATASGWMGYKVVAAIAAYSGNTVQSSGGSAAWAGVQASFKLAAAGAVAGPAFDRILRGMRQ